MARQKKNRGPTFDCEDHIDAMERAVIEAMVPREYTAEDVLRLFVPGDTIDKLKTAHPLTQRPPAMSWDGRFQHERTGYRVHFAVATNEIGILAPNDVTLNHEQMAVHGFLATAQTGAILASVEDALRVKEEFNTARTVVSWLNTSGANASWARHYIPSLGSLLPGDHAFHQGGSRYKDVHMPIHIAMAIRKLPEVVTRGIMCASRPLEGKTVCWLQFGDGQSMPWLQIAA